MIQPDAQRNPRWWTLALAAVGALALVSGLAVIDSLPVGVFHDDAMYVILARSLASGHGLRYLNIPGSPAATHFPPAYPALLAIITWIVPASATISAYKVANALLLAAGAVLITIFGRARSLDPVWATVLGVVSAVSVPTLVLGSMVLSEPLFLVALVAALMVIEPFVDRPSSARTAAMVGVGIGLCVLVRSHGIVLLPATLLALGARRRWRDALIVTTATIIVLAPWQVWIAMHTGVLPAPLQGNYESYTSWWIRGLRVTGVSMVRATLAKTVPEASEMFAVLFSPFRGTVAHAATLLALGALALAGLWRTWRRMPTTWLFLAGYLALVLIWPFPPARFIWAVWPLLLLAVVAAANSAARTLGKHASSRDRRVLSTNLATLAAFGWIAAGYSTYEVHGVKGAWWGSVARSNARRIMPAIDWVAANTAPNEVVAAEDEGAIYLYTGRLTVPVLSFTTDQYLRDVSATENAGEGLRPILEAYPIGTVVVGTRKTVDAADALVAARPPLLSRGMDFAGGVAYRTVGRR